MLQRRQLLSAVPEERSLYRLPLSFCLPFEPENLVWKLYFLNCSHIIRAVLLNIKVQDLQSSSEAIGEEVWKTCT